MRCSIAIFVAVALGACGEPAPADGGADAPPIEYDAGPRCFATAADFPAPTPGRCRAVVADGAELPAGDDGAGGVIVPGGERLTRVGRNVTVGGFPMRAIAIPGTRFVVVTDGGLRDETLAVVNVDTLDIVYEETFRGTAEALFLGLAVSSDGRRLWASGGGTNEVLAYDVDPATGVLTPSPARSFTVSTTVEEGYVSGLALRDDGVLAVALLFGDQILFYDTVAGRELRRAPLDELSRAYDVVFTPDGADVWVSLWASRQVARVDVATGAVETTVGVGKNPQGLALSPDGTTLAVACSDSDSIAIVDVVSGILRETVWVIGEDAPRGVAPAALRYGADGRLYVANALENAIDVFDPARGYARVGAVPTMWHPTDVLPLEDGTLAFVNGRHVGTGPNVSPGSDDITGLVGGSLSVLDPGTLDDAQLAAWELEIDADDTRMTRFVDVDCGGAAYDFPIPVPGGGPSTVLRHVVLIVRENKTYDAYLGDLTDDAGAPHGNGDPALTLIPSAEMEQVIPNTRELARRFAMSDNYYSHAEQSIQGHFWTTHGRTTDFVERTWLTSWGRGYWPTPPAGLSEVGQPEEGSAFDFVVRNDVSATNYGEIIGASGLAPARGFPGLVYSYLPDRDKGDFVASEVQRECNLRSFTYIVLPNDHTQGLAPGRQTPRSMIADNDDGVARVVHGISHSTFWPETVIFVIEDDPQDGGDHVDNHRSPLLIVSPWARRGHVSSVHASEASIFRTIQLIFGVAAPHNRSWEHAAPLYDAFTSTPDFTPYERIERRWPEETNPFDDSMMATISENYDWSMPDEQPGLSRLLWQHFRGSAPPWPIYLELEGDEDEDEGIDER